MSEAASAFIHRRMKFDPMKPEPPVTRIVDMQVPRLRPLHASKSPALDCKQIETVIKKLESGLRGAIIGGTGSVSIYGSWVDVIPSEAVVQAERGTSLQRMSQASRRWRRRWVFAMTLRPVSHSNCVPTRLSGPPLRTPAFLRPRDRLPSWLRRQIQVHDFEVRFLDLGGDRSPLIVLPHPPARRAPGRLPNRRISQQKSQPVRQVSGVTALKGESRLVHDLAILRHIAGQNANSGAHRIQQCQGQPLHI